MTSKIQRSNSLPVIKNGKLDSSESSRFKPTQSRPRTHSLDAGRPLTGRVLTHHDGTPVANPHSPHSLQIMNTLPEAIHFERTIRVGNFLYKVTTELPDDPELNEGYLQTNLLPQVTKAIELATQNDSLKNAEQFDLEFKPEGLSATPYRSTESSGSSIRLDEQQIWFESTEASALCENVRQMLDNPRAYIEKRPDSSKKSEISSSNQRSPSLEKNSSSRRPTEQLPSPVSKTLLIAPHSPVPFLEHGANSCFLAVFIWTYLSNHQEIREELRAKAAALNNRSWFPWSWSQSAEEKAILALDSFATKLEKHQAAGTYVPKSDINQLRDTLALLRPELFRKGEMSQKDTHEAMTLLLGMFDRASKTQIAVTHTVNGIDVPAPPLHDLFLPLPVQSHNPTEILKKRDGSNFNLQEILGAHFNSDSQFDYRVSKAQVVKAAGTTYRMSKCPRYLEITLGRLNDANQKINGDIDVPLEMTLTEMITNETPPPTYRLRSVIRHEGSSSNSGHFTSIARKDAADGVHNYHCDDIGSSNGNGTCSSVKEVNDSYCLEKAKGAYMLVYEKVEKPTTETFRVPTPIQTGAEKLSTLKSLSRDENAKIFEETFELSSHFAIPRSRIIASMPNPITATPYAARTPIAVMPTTTLKAAQDLVLNHKLNPLVLDMANPTSIGGNPYTANAQEEILCRQSNLFRGLQRVAIDQDANYQIPVKGGIYVPGVQFLRNDPNENYAMLKTPFQADVFASAAFICNTKMGVDCPTDYRLYEQGTKEKIRAMFRVALSSGSGKERNDSLVLGAFGCGAFGNDPESMARWYRDVLNEREFQGQFKQVVFAISEDHNSKNRNFKAFQKEFSPRGE